MFSKYLDPKNDLAFRKIFGQEKHKRISIAFLNTVFHLEQEERIVDLEFLNTIQPPEIEARKESVVDVLVRDQRGSKYIVEMQVVKVEGFEKRAQYYAAKTYCTHFNVGGEYVDLKRVTFLAITSYIVFPKKEDYKSDHVILDKSTYENDLKDFSFTFVELPKFNKTLTELSTIEEKWYYFLKHAQETDDIDAILASNPEIQEAYAVLERTQWTEKELLEYERIAMAVADAKGALSAARKEGLKEGREEGLKEGREEGLREGHKEGRRSEKIELVHKLLKRHRPLQEIAEYTGLTEEEIKLLNLSQY